MIYTIMEYCYLNTQLGDKPFVRAHVSVNEIIKQLPQKLAHPLILEVISHHYTLRAKDRITEIFPETTLTMNKEDRSFKYDQLGYVYFPPYFFINHIC